MRADRAITLLALGHVVTGWIALLLDVGTRTDRLIMFTAGVILAALSAATREILKGR